MPSFFDPLQSASYRTIVIDPPWKFSAGTKSRPQHYPRMSDAEIAALPISSLCHPDGANIFVWITSPVAERFWRKIYPVWRREQRIRYSGRGFVWVKTHAATERGGVPLFFHRNSLHTSTGFTTRKNAEDCLLFKTGRPKRMSRSIHEIIIAPLREHSRKPEESFLRISAYGEGPRAEIFSRQPRAGWDVFGNEADKFKQVAA